MAAVKFLLGIFCFTLTGSINNNHSNLLKQVSKVNRLTAVSDANTRTQLVKIAGQEVGVREKTGNNDGTRVELYLASVGLKKGEPWCAAFICWIFKQQGFLNPHSGWTPALFPSSRLARSALPGDVFGIYFPSKKRIAHVGMVVEVDGDWCLGIEGNTNIAGGREGDGVFKKRRNMKTIYRIADWVSVKKAVP